MRWQEHAHLFANGKFKLTDGKYIVPFLMEYIWDSIQGAYFKHYEDDKFHELYLKDSKLIARPISDMTDEEARKIYGKSPDPDVCRKALIHKANRKILYGSEERDMTDVGVYFGPQSHFDDGTVIDATKLEKT